MGLQTQATSSTHKREACRRSLLRTLGTLSRARDISPEVLHKMRVNLRRLQAWFELVGNKRSAEVLGERVSLVSPLRTLQVLEGWLARRKAPPSDLRKVRRASREMVEQLADDRVFATIRQTVNDLNGLDRDADNARRRKAWLLHLDVCTPLLSALRKNPKRKRLHALRLKLKQLRYQLEWVMSETGRHERLLERLKQAQRCLGDYEEQAAFRKVAKQLKLQSHPAIMKRWRRARKKARALPQDMSWLPASLRQLVRHETSRAPGNRVLKRVNADVTTH